MPLQIALTEAPRLRERLQVWKRDYVTAVRELFGAEPDAWQAEVLEAFPTSDRIALVACANPGKTTVQAWIGWIFLLTHEDAQAKAVAISGTNLKTNLWKELAFWHGKSPLLEGFFTIGTKRISNIDRPNTWFMEAANWDRDATPEQQGKVLAGLHARAVLFLLDEAGGIPDAVALTAENALAGDGEAHVVLAGNPLSLSGPLYRAAVLQPQLWTVFQVTGDPDDPKRAPRVSLKWAREQIEAYGRDSSYVQTYVLGQFPKGATDALVPLKQFEDAFARWDSSEPLSSSPRALGLDVARFGADSSVLCYREGDLVPGFEQWQGQDTEYTASRAMDACVQWAADILELPESAPEVQAFARELPIMVDDIGVGGGVTDKLLAAGFNVTGVNVGSSPADKIKFSNLRAELNMHVQDRFAAGGIALHPTIRKETTVMAEGTTLRVGYASGTSKRKIEGKAEYKKRTGRSPDYWDALVLAFHPGAGVPLVSF